MELEEYQRPFPLRCHFIRQVSPVLRKPPTRIDETQKAVQIHTFYTDHSGFAIS